MTIADSSLGMTRVTVAISSVQLKIDLVADFAFVDHDSAWERQLAA